MDEKDILGQIHGLVQSERELRGGGHEETTAEAEQLRRIEVALDQCWDLLRQRRAHQEFGESPDTSTVRPESTVEGYLQ